MPKESQLDRIERKLDELLSFVKGEGTAHNIKQERKLQTD